MTLKKKTLAAIDAFTQAEIVQLTNALCPHLAKLKRLDRRTQDNQREACESALEVLSTARRYLKSTRKFTFFTQD